MPLTNPSSNCLLCGPGLVPETIDHALGPCEANQGLPARLLELLRLHQQGAEQRQFLTLDIGLDPSLELPITWTICSLLFSIWRQRGEGRINMARTRAELEDKCRLLREGKVSSQTNTFTMTNSILGEMFR